SNVFSIQRSIGYQSNVMLIPNEPMNALIRESHGLLQVPFLKAVLGSLQEADT
ncbi:hypothetical protein ACO22_03925, partial [Paracoccidioides brasiliensis]